VTVAGNFIGVELDGATGEGNAGNGLEIHASSGGNTIGGTGANDRNVISANGGTGISIVGSARNSVVANFIGTDVSGTADLGNADNGVSISSGANSNTIGSPRTGAGNEIAFKLGSGVTVLSGNRNTIRGNSIHSNAALGIELGPTGNTGVSAPTPTSAVPSTGSTIRVGGAATGRAGSVVTVDVYANFNDEPLDVTEGWLNLGSVSVTIGTNGVGRFVFEAYNPPPGLQVFTATATNAAGSTSKFSAGIQSVGP